MQASTETLSPTRVKLTVEVPFDELKPSIDAAYKKLAGQVRVQGFRPGKVPPRILDQRLGRGTVLDEALQDALPRLYSQVVQEQSVDVMGRPAVDVTSFADGSPLVFTAEVDVRPEVELPDYRGLEVSVDDVSVSDEDVDHQLASLQDRYAVLHAVEREVRDADYVTLDLSATVDGEPVPGAEATGLAHEVGGAQLIDGLDDAIRGASVGDERTFPTTLVAGDFAGREAQVTAVVRTVKEKEVPGLDDEFAQTASEFDTIAELRGEARERLETSARLQQGVQARDRALEALLERVDVPLPESAVTDEAGSREHDLGHQLEAAGMTREQYLESLGQDEETFAAELRTGAESSVKAQLVLDAIADKEEIGVTEPELSDLVVRRAQRFGLAPDDFARRLVEAGQLPAMLVEVRRGKALALVLEAAKVTDASGRAVDLSALTGPAVADDAAAPVPHDHDHEGHDHEGHDYEGHDHEGHDHGDHEGHDRD